MAAAKFVPFNWNLTSRCEGFSPLLLLLPPLLLMLLPPPLLLTMPGAQLQSA
jgi:hypothetical protein